MRPRNEIDVFLKFSEDADDRQGEVVGCAESVRGGKRTSEPTGRGLMDVQGRERPSRSAFLSRVALMAGCLAASGCLGPAAVRSTRMRYNEVVRSTSDEQLLMNLVRLRYADTPVFIDLPNITSQFELASGGSY